MNHRITVPYEVGPVARERRCALLTAVRSAPSSIFSRRLAAEPGGVLDAVMNTSLSFVISQARGARHGRALSTYMVSW
jgi:hypothetical protein